MLEPFYTSRFSKDLKRAERRGKDQEKFKATVKILSRGEALDRTFSDHKLQGSHAGKRGYHLEPDWVVIYRIDRKKNLLIFERTGSHSDLF